MSLKDQLEDGLKAAMKSGDRVAVAAIRLSLSEIKNAMIDKRRPLEDNEIVNILRSGVKKRQESIEMFAKGGRQELVEKEAAEIKVARRVSPGRHERRGARGARRRGDRRDTGGVDEGHRQDHEVDRAARRRPRRRGRSEQADQARFSA